MFSKYSHMKKVKWCWTGTSWKAGEFHSVNKSLNTWSVSKCFSSIHMLKLHWMAISCNTIACTEFDAQWMASHCLGQST
jgi:hypothetical protein